LMYETKNHEVMNNDEKNAQSAPLIDSGQPGMRFR